MESFRYNYEATDENLLVCYNNHQKESPCEFVKLCPHDALKHINEMRSAALESAAILARHNALKKAVAKMFAAHKAWTQKVERVTRIGQMVARYDAARSEVDRLLSEEK